MVSLSARKLLVCKPRLHRRGKGAGLEAPVPVYEAMRDDTNLREGRGKLFTVNRLGVTPKLRRCLTTTNIWMLKAQLDALNEKKDLHNQKRVT